MWCRLTPLLVLALVLVPPSGADTVSEFDRCALGDCQSLTAAGGVTVAPADGAGDRNRDGASVSALKRSAQDAPAEVTEQDEGSGEGAFGASDETGSPDVDPAEQSTEAAAEEEVTTAPAEPEPATGSAPPPSSAPEGLQGGGSGPPEPTEGDAGAADGGGDGADGLEDSGAGPEGGGAGPAETDEGDWRTDHCTCDMTVSECDPDCCCDRDCTPRDRLAFSACQRRPSTTPDRRYCLQSDLLFANNTEHKLERVEGGLFCIVRDNLVSRTRFPTVEPVSSSVEFDRLLSRSVRRHRYQWETEPPPPPPPPAADRYRSGDLLWAVADGTPKHWAVRWRGPVSAGLCDSVRPVRFLRPAHTDCWLPADPADLQPLDGRGVYQGVCLMTTPPSDPDQELEDVQCDGGVRGPDIAEGATDRPPAQALPVVPYLCDAHHQNCTRASAVPSPRLSSGRLLDVLLSVLFVVEQRAGRLSAVRAELVLGAAPLGSAVRQRRRVEFRRPAAPPPVHRSGSPGYQRHRPLLAAALLTNSSGEGPPRRFPAGVPRPILLPSPGRGGGCSADTGHWRPLAFGVDAAVSCRLEAAGGDCSALQRRLLETLLAGLPAPAADTAVAAFGSAAADGDWVPLLDSRPQLSPETTPAGCRGLVAAAEWRVLFAQTGAAWRPQARVVGVRLRYGRPVTVRASPGAGGGLTVTVQSTVTFQDVTRRPVPSFARPPRVDISLPADFFYPFSSGGPGGSAPALTALLAAGLTLTLVR